MALNATIYKLHLHIADMDRHYYHDHALTVALHPSETAERMMARVLAFALNADEALNFGKGLSTEDEPALWRKDMTGAIQLWIDVGLPDEKDIRKACGRARHVIVYSYGRNADLWWRQHQQKLERFDNLSVVNLPTDGTQTMAKMTQRSMELQCTVQDGEVWLADENDRVEVGLVILKAPSQ